MKNKKYKQFYIEICTFATVKFKVPRKNKTWVFT